MAKPLIMPKFGFSQETAEIVRWIKHEGDEVEQGDPIAEVTTDKVNMEVEATASGILAGLKYQEGDTVAVTEIIAYILDPGESLPTRSGVNDQPKTRPTEPPVEPVEDRAATDVNTEKKRARRITPLAEQFARENGVDWSQVAGSGPGGRIMRSDLAEYMQANQQPSGTVRATPNARRLARENGVDLSQVKGSGPHNRVQGWDVQVQANRIQETLAKPSVSDSTTDHPTGQEQVIPLSSVRRLIAERMQRSSQEAPHVYIDADIDVTQLLALQKRMNEKLVKGQTPISLTALLVKAVAWALNRHPFLNSRLMNDGIHLLPEIHVGVAVSVDQGLIVPVLRRANRKQVAELAAEMNTLVTKARENKLRPDDVSEGTFTISNLGMFGVDRFTAIINPPQTAILAVGRVRKLFMPDENDRPQARPMMTVTLGADHRVVDGAVAAKFLADVREALEHPEIMVL